jgi:predicted nucleic acid-binding protein
MVDRAFLDTGILLRSTHINASMHDEVDKLVSGMRQDGYELWISRQVIREYLVQVTRPGILRQPLGIKQVKNRLKTLRMVYQVADETNSVTDKLTELLEAIPSGGKQIHDANIVATMMAYDIDTLLTLNVAHMQRFESKINIVTLPVRRKNGNSEES